MKIYIKIKLIYMSVRFLNFKYFELNYDKYMCKFLIKI